MAKSIALAHHQTTEGVEAEQVIIDTDEPGRVVLEFDGQALNLDRAELRAALDADRKAAA